MRLVLDTNSVLQSIAHWSRYHDLWLSILDGRNQLCVTTEILNEYAEIIERKTNAQFSSLAIEVIINNPNTLFINTFYNFNLIQQDPDDNKFVDCAVAAGAKFIVSNDHHYDILKDIVFPRIEVIPIEKMMKFL